MKILVFGSSSRVSRVFNQFFKKHQIINLQRKKNSFLDLKNIIYFNNLFEANISKLIKETDVIINFAGESIDSKKMFNSNILFIKNLTNQINKNNKKCFFIHLSTCGIYQDTSINVNNISEKTSVIPYQIYPKTKYFGEQYILRNCKSRKLIIRPAQILGIGMSNSSIYRLKYYLKKNLFFFINDKTALWSFTDINNLMECIDYFLNKKNNNILDINIASTIKLSDVITSLKNKFKINSFQPIISIQVVKLIISIAEIFKIKHPLKKNVIRSLTLKKKFNSDKIKKIIKLTNFDDVEY